MKELDCKVIIGSDGKTPVKVYDGDVVYQNTKTSVNYKYFFDENGKRVKTRQYSQYTAMTNRCKENHSNYEGQECYKGVKLSPEFDTYDKWVYWAENQVGYMCLDEKGSLFQQDKDLFGDGYEYSPNKCCFIPPQLNNILQMFSSMVKGVRVSSCGGYFYIYNHKKYFVKDKSEAVFYAEKRDRETLINYIHNNIHWMDDKLIERLLVKIDDLKERETACEEQMLSDVKRQEFVAKFKKDYFGFFIEKSKDGLPVNVSKVYVRKKPRFVVQMTFRGKTLLDKHRENFDTLVEAEVFATEKRLEVFKFMEETYFQNDIIHEKLRSEFYRKKFLAEEKLKMLVCGMF